jgi:hypothetical protein
MPVGRLTASQPKLSGSPAVQRPPTGRRGPLAQAAHGSVVEQISMPISQFLGNSKFDPETKRIMGGRTGASRPGVAQDRGLDGAHGVSEATPGH